MEVPRDRFAGIECELKTLHQLSRGKRTHSQRDKGGGPGGMTPTQDCRQSSASENLKTGFQDCPAVRTSAVGVI